MKATLDMEKTAAAKLDGMIADRFASAKFDKKRIKAFASEIAKMEAGGAKLVDWRDHGQAPDWDMTIAHFRVPRSKLQSMIELMLRTEFHPHVLINGLLEDILKGTRVKDEIVDMRVMVGGR